MNSQLFKIRIVFKFTEILTSVEVSFGLSLMKFEMESVLSRLESVPDRIETRKTRKIISILDFFCVVNECLTCALSSTNQKMIQPLE